MATLCQTDHDETPTNYEDHIGLSVRKTVAQVYTYLADTCQSPLTRWWCVGNIQYCPVMLLQDVS